MRHGHIGMLGSLAMMAAAASIVAAPRRIAISDDGSNGPVTHRQHFRNTRLNRSRKWDHAASYADAREMSPFPHKPVR